MILSKLHNKKICILGLGIENYALVRFLLGKKVKCEITICDARSKKELGEKHTVIARTPVAAGERSNPVNITRKTGSPRRFAPRDDINIKWRLGKNYDQDLNQFNIIFRSPGCPLFNPNLLKAKKAGVEVSSPMKLFFALCPTKNIIGVTGTKGKGTTACLIYHVLKKAGKHVWLGGNIGVAPFEFISKIKKNNWLVLELSSFQLEDMTVSPKIAVITNFYKEHLAPADPNNPNYHKTLAGYWRAKLNIVKWQRKSDFAVINRKLKVKKPKIKSKIIYFTKSNLPSKLIGEHNKENIAAAAEVAKIVGVKQDIIKKAVASFNGLEHRLEYIKTIKGVRYYNDSFATTPESTITALKSFNQPIVLLAGGAEKKSDFQKLAKEIKKRVKFVVLLKGDATFRLKKKLLKNGFAKNQMKLICNIKDAVRVARKKADKGDVVLLSTACASFGMFKNYKERGELFKREVGRL